MQQTCIGLVAAAIMATAIPVIGQSASTTADSSTRSATLIGCLEKNKSGGFWLKEVAGGTTASASATTAPSASSATTTADATAASSSSTDRSATTATGTTGTVAATTTADDKAGANAAHWWNLQNAHDLDQYVNQTIQVTGRAKDSTSGDEVVGTTGPEVKARDFDVSSVRRIAGSCS